MESRRVFLQALGVVPLAGACAKLFGRNEVSLHYGVAENSISVLQTELGQTRLVQSIASNQPAAVAIDSQNNFLFAVNSISEYQGLPAGSVEAYSIEPATGFLSLINRQALSLSATQPRDIAVSPDGRFLVVAVFGGGAYNVLPVRTHGEISPVSQIVKEIGNSVNAEKQLTAHPHSVVFHPSGKFLIGSDLGSDRINVFSFNHGRLTVVSRLEVPAGSGPAGLTTNAGGTTMRVEHEISGRSSLYRFDANSGRLFGANA